MADYNNPNGNGYYGANGYINFDQFIMQHNIGQYNTAPMYENYPQEEIISNYFVPNMHSDYIPEDVIRNSNLLPTANEFVPMKLNVNNHANDASPITTTNTALDNNNIETFNCKPELNEEHDRDELLAALSATNIGNRQGAVKKTQSSNSINSNRNPATSRTNYNSDHSNWRENYQNKDRNDRRKNQTNERDDWRRDVQYESRRCGSGRTASQYADRHYSNQNISNASRGGSDRDRERHTPTDDRQHNILNYYGTSDERDKEKLYGKLNYGSRKDDNHGIKDRNYYSQGNDATATSDDRDREKAYGKSNYGSRKDDDHGIRDRNYYSQGNDASAISDDRDREKPYGKSNYCSRKDDDHGTRDRSYYSHGIVSKTFNDRSHYKHGSYTSRHGDEKYAQKNVDRQNYDKRSDAGIVSVKHHPDLKPNRNLKLNFEPTVNSGECSQREKLIREIESGKLECLVCCEIIKPFQSSWSCSNCFHIIHLNCVVKWAASSKSEDGWRCPACQNITKKVPQDYYCFCGKQKNPSYNRNDVAHSCGELCGKMDGCEHPCILLCHPGPCPSCQATVTRKCGCGRSQKIMQCSQKKEIKCNEICDQKLNCLIHNCEEKCHISVCVDCERKVDHKCFCGKDKREVICTVENNEITKYSCGKNCNRSLSCKNHKCKEICHPGDCGDCKLLPEYVTSCPCGKAPVLLGQRKSCTDQVPLCNAVCGKPLQCGPTNNSHLCTNKCHNGKCATCNKETAVKCRCGHMDQMIKCRLLSTRTDDARCKKRCTKKRNCGKHKCNQECCIDIDHICPNPCNYTLSCGKHKCDQTCHKGRCRSCYRSSFDELHCECGANVIYPPVPCGTKKPACDRPCSRTHLCDHPIQHNCHSAVVCPPCMAFTSKFCFGKHEQRKTIPCIQENFSCGLPCNKQLRCEHKCIRPCHGAACETVDNVCKQNCTKSRIMCSHNCNAPCHTGPCPDTPCRENVEVLCQCGNRKQTRACHDFSNDFRRIATAKLASTMQDMQRGNSVELCDVLGSVKMNNNKTLDCNDECKLVERNRMLDIAFQTRNPDTLSKLQTKYSDFIKGWAKKDAQLVGMIHDKLTDLVKLAKENKQRSRSHSFPTMNREKRQLVHEMCAMFGVESVAYDAEPNRNVVAIAAKDTTWFPAMSIFEILQRESGHRRIPVPSNNAWGVKR